MNKKQSGIVSGRHRFRIETTLLEKTRNIKHDVFRWEHYKTATTENWGIYVRRICELRLRNVPIMFLQFGWFWAQIFFWKSSYKKGVHKWYSKSLCYASLFEWFLAMILGLWARNWVHNIGPRRWPAKCLIENQMLRFHFPKNILSILILFWQFKIPWYCCLFFRT